MEAIPNFDIYIFVAVILFILGLFSTVLYSRMEPRERDKYSSYGGGSVEDFVKLADDEEIIRDYNVATVEKPSYGEVHFAITNKRLIMYGLNELYK